MVDSTAGVAMRPVCPAFPRCSRSGWTGQAVTGGPVAAVNRCARRSAQGQLRGSRRVRRRAERVMRAGTVSSCRRMVAVVALAWNTRGQAAGGAGQVERDRGEDQPRGVRGEPPGGQMRERAVLQVGDDLLDDGVPAVRGLGVEHRQRRVSEHGVVAPLCGGPRYGVAAGGSRLGIGVWVCMGGIIRGCPGRRAAGRWGGSGPVRCSPGWCGRGRVL